jgi:hypothetical protein
MAKSPFGQESEDLDPIFDLGYIEDAISRVRTLAESGASLEDILHAAVELEDVYDDARSKIESNLWSYIRRLQKSRKALSKARLIAVVRPTNEERNKKICRAADRLRASGVDDRYIPGKLRNGIWDGKRLGIKQLGRIIRPALKKVDIRTRRNVRLSL